MAFDPDAYLKEASRAMNREQMVLESRYPGLQEMSERYRGTTGGQPTTTQLSQQDQQALDWANAHPDDPRSAQIRQRLGR